jgi:UDP-N-acetylmuramoyl-tripeptide--D-alanyl-D-alanine ligase
MGTPIPRNSAAFSLGQVAAVTGGRLLAGDPGQTVTGVSTDSRSLEKGNLFVALRGEKHDGHRFLEQAAESGAGGLLVQGDAAVPRGPAAVQVNDTLKALGDLAAAYRRRFSFPLVAVTGSMGKTSTKELIGAALAACGMRVLCSRGNLNNLVGVPMSLFLLEEGLGAAVLELGSSAPGEIARLGEITRPEVAVVTGVAAAHTEQLGSVENVAREKASLLHSLGPAAAAVYNADAPHLAGFLKHLSTSRIMSYGRSTGASVRLLGAEMTQEPATRCGYEIQTLGLELQSELGLLGEGAALNAAAALCVVLALGREEQIEQALAGISGVQPVPGRLYPLPGPRGSLLLDDTYNCNPESAVVSLATAGQLARARRARAIAVLGDMAELGRLSRPEHERVGREAVRLGMAALIACGPRMEDAADAARREAEASNPGERTIVMHFADPLLAAGPARDRIENGDVVLIKGSRSMAMERVLDEIRSTGAMP